MYCVVFAEELSKSCIVLCLQKNDRSRVLCCVCRGIIEVFNVFLQCSTMKEFKEILKGYKEKTSGCKSGLMLRVYAIYCRISSNTQSDLPQNSFDGDQPTSYESFIKRECILLSWTTDLRRDSRSQLVAALSLPCNKDRKIWTKLLEDNLIQKVEGLSVLL